MPGPLKCRVKEEYIKKFIYDVSSSEIQQWLAEHGQAKFRAKQLKRWLAKGIENVDELSDQPKELRVLLAQDFDFEGISLTNIYQSNIDSTTKYVFTLKDGSGVESVYMEYKHGASVCLSSQAGCRMGCAFCASTGLGFVRNLTAGELYAQVARIAKHKQKRISNIVVMGIGEPFENYEELLKFCYMVNEEDGLNIGMRHITVSTCGLVPEIRRLADSQLQITLALSLHAPNDKLRQELMPIAYKYKLNELMDAVRYYVDKTKRRITFEYAMFDGVNDKEEYALELLKLIKGLLCHINLIPANEFEGGKFKRSKAAQVAKFQKIITDAGYSCTVRRELGKDISAACGQLRRKLNL